MAGCLPGYDELIHWAVTGCVIPNIAGLTITHKRENDQMGYILNPAVERSFSSSFT